MSYSKDLAEHIRAASESHAFSKYKEARSAILALIDESKSDAGASDYWKQEIAGFEYLFDASPLIIETLRHHSYHLTGLYEYHYRTHHARMKGPYREKLALLKTLDSKSLLVPESPALGGFGYDIDGALYNLDTLKFYEFLIGLDKAGFIEPVRNADRPVVVEIGSGWGGFAYQFKTLFPKTSYVLVDLPHSLLLAATYIQALFPDAHIYLGNSIQSYAQVDFSQYDFIFVPNTAWGTLRKQRIDLAMNMISFQEMTDEQVRSYVSRQADFECPRLYSLNRDRSPNNSEISVVIGIMSEQYRVEHVSVLPVPYHVLKTPKLSFIGSVKHIVKQVIGRKSKPMSREYQHASGVLSA